jgi:Na+-driven multidrug efflux pump
MEMRPIDMELCTTSTSRETRKGIFKLAWPSITEQMLIMMVGIVSTVMIGHIGKEAIVAVGMVNMIIFFIQAVFSAL